MSETDETSPSEDLESILQELQPRLQDVIKRSFTNIAVQQCSNGFDSKTEQIEDVSYAAKHTQVNLFRVELMKPPLFHIQDISLNLNMMRLTIRCSLGDINIKSLYSAFNENLYNLLPVMSEGHVGIVISNVFTYLDVGLSIADDKFTLVNPNVEITHDDISVQMSWPAPQRNGEYEFVTTEQIAKHMDELPISLAVSRPLNKLIRNRLLKHLQVVLKQMPTVSDLFECKDTIINMYINRVASLSDIGNKITDIILINMRRTLLQNQREVLELPSMIASFVHKVGSVSFVGKFDTDTGWIKNLATVNRVSDVSVIAKPNKYTFSTSLKVKDLKIGFNEYRIKLMGVGPTGRLLVTIGDNSIYLQVTTGISQWHSYSQLDQIKVEYFDKLDVHITGLGPLNWLVSNIATWMLGFMQTYAIPFVEKQLKAEIHRAFDEITLWEHIHRT